MKTAPTGFGETSGKSAGLPENPFTDSFNDPGFFRQRNKFSGRHRPMLGAIPAQQRFKPFDFPVGQPHFRLILQSEFIIFQRPAQAVRHSHGFIRILLHPGIIDAPAVASAGFRRIHGDIGVLQHFVRS